MLEGREIASIMIVTQQGGHVYQIGERRGDKKISKIVDKSMEYENHIHSLYWVLNEDGKMTACIENCPIVVEYRKAREGVSK